MSRVRDGKGREASPKLQSKRRTKPLHSPTQAGAYNLSSEIEEVVRYSYIEFRYGMVGLGYTQKINIT
jgi:hypothetical protein